jgi:transposase, IS30 family
MGLGIGEIARRLGRHRTTIHREIARNRCVGGYRPDSAERRAWARKLRGSKIEHPPPLRAYIKDPLAMGWSPEQTAGWMEREESEPAISAESIYRHLQALVVGARACRGCSPSASPSAAGDGATVGASRQSQTAC